MPLREFSDVHGRPWRVWDTRPTTGRLRVQFVDGWLTFERLEEEAPSIAARDLGASREDVTGDAATARRRRLAPIPDGWAELPDLDLRRLCLEALPERPRRRLIE